LLPTLGLIFVSTVLQKEGKQKQRMPLQNFIFSLKYLHIVVYLTILSIETAFLSKRIILLHHGNETEVTGKVASSTADITEQVSLEGLELRL
jgi:hypothetical protein